jgi:molybdopterin-containing oxidoreductase family iron-sulfur binding subunit
MSGNGKNGTTKTVRNTMGYAVNEKTASAPEPAHQASTALAPMTLDAVRQDLKAVKGKRFWRSLDELADTADFQAAVEKEFPSAAQEWVDPVSRRGFLKLMGASMALAGLAGCTKQPDEPIYPYVKAPEDLILGKPMYFATAHPFTTGAVPLLVKSDEFRPIKIDGNPEHAYNMGSSDPYSQGTLLALYDPDRSQHATYRGETREWQEFAQVFRAKAVSTKDGSGIYFLSTTITSPTLARQWQAVQKAYPKAKLVQYDPALAGTFLANGLNVQYALDQADVIVSLDADFLSGASYPGFHKLVRDYANRRRQPENGMNRLYAIESTPTTTGMKAEHRLGLRASEIPAFTAALAQAVGAAGVQAPSYAWTPDQQKFLAALAKDLKSNAGKSAVIPGLYQDPSVAALALAINNALGNIGKTVFAASDPLNPIPSDQLEDFKSLVADLNAGKVDWLVILNANPIYDAPADLNFADAFNKANIVAHLGSHVDETGQISHWHIPAAHYLEYWSDARAYDGTVSIVQPLIDPLYGGRSAHNVFQILLDEPMVSSYDAVRETWKSTIKGDFETGWRKALHDGWIENTAFDKTGKGTANVGFRGSVPAPTPKDSLEIIFRPDPTIYDGRWSNVGWLQELPKPVTNLSWDNAAIVSGATLAAKGWEEDDIVEITVGNGKVKAPVIVAPGHPDNSVTVYLGYGREFAGRVGSGAGFNAYQIRNTWAPFYATGSIRKVDGKWGTAITKSHYQDHRSARVSGEGNGNNSLEGDEAIGERGIIRYATLDEFKANPNFAHEGEGRDTPEMGTSLSQLDLQRSQCLGHVHRHEQLHRLQCLHCELLRREQHRRRGQAAGPHRPQHAVAAHRYLLRGRFIRASRPLPAHGLPALRKRALRAGLPRRRNRTHARRPQHHGLQPLRGHALLLQQLPLQGSALQLPALLRLRDREPQADAQSRCHRSLPRRHGKVQLLRAAHPGRQNRVRQGKPPHPRRRDRHGLPAGLPGLRHYLWKHQRQAKPGFKSPRQPTQLPGHRRSKYPSPDHLCGRGPQSEPGTRSSAGRTSPGKGLNSQWQPAI